MCLKAFALYVCAPANWVPGTTENGATCTRMSCMLPARVRLPGSKSPGSDCRSQGQVWFCYRIAAKRAHKDRLNRLPIGMARSFEEFSMAHARTTVACMPDKALVAK